MVIRQNALPEQAASTSRRCAVTAELRRRHSAQMQRHDRFTVPKGRGEWYSNVRGWRSPGAERHEIPTRGQDSRRLVVRGASVVASSRLTREDWIAVARKAFIASGVDDVKIDVLARRMKVTRGSFYWHFAHRQDLLDALLQDWEASNRREIGAIEARAVGEGNELIELFKIWLDEDPSFPAFDIAIRGWARKSKSVAKVVHAVDDAWIAMLQAHFERTGMSAPLSFVRARVMYFHQVGYLALSIKESLAERIRLAPYYYEALTGSPVPEGLMDNLKALDRPKTRSRRTKVSTVGTETPS